MFNWFNTREVDAFAKSIVEDLLERYPPDGKDFEPKKAVERLVRTHDALFARVGSFAKSAKLNAYKIAHLGTQVKWGLKDAGYPKDFIDTFTIELLAVLTVQKRKRD